MVRSLVSAALSRLSPAARRRLRMWRCRRAIRRGHFHADEPEFDVLDRYLVPGDWVLDLGANIGAYTLRFSALVGPLGRVIAVEPVPDTFAVLTANASFAPHPNITLLNVAASDGVGIGHMEVPTFEHGGENIYQAALTESTRGIPVARAPIGAVVGPNRVGLVKIDVEGHETEALRGIEQILKRDHPPVIVECTCIETHELLESLGYERQPDLPGSPNHTFLWRSPVPAQRAKAVATAVTEG